MSSMRGWTYKGAAMLCGVSGAAMAGGVGHAPIAWVGAQVAPALPQVFQPSYVPPAPAPADPVSYAIDQWKRIQQSDNLPFSDYANFLLAHPGWPGETSRRAAAETAIDPNSWSPTLAVRFSSASRR